MNCLYDMMYEDLKELVEDVLHLEYWCVRDDELRNRMDSIAYSDRFKELKERATEKGYTFNDIEKIWKDKRVYIVPHKTYHQQFFLVKGDNSTVVEVADNAILLY